jgi:CheY-like chemotaxis protein
VLALDAGADDYVTKPFAVDQFLDGSPWATDIVRPRCA